MDFPKQLKDVVYGLLQEPTLEKFREFLRAQTGEHNAIDFKAQWIEDAALAKEMLSLANTQGGFIVFGVAENEDKSTRVEGLSEIKDKAIVSNGVKKYISSELKYEIYDFSYTTSEYEALNGKHFQMLVVEDTPEHIPFMAQREGKDIKQNMIYIRRGTSCEIANQEELQKILDRRLNYMHPITGEPLQLAEHLRQLKILYENIDKNHVYYKNGLPEGMTTILSSLAKMVSSGEKIVEPNPLYPDESFDAFISRMIVEKKKKIQRVLDLN